VEQARVVEVFGLNTLFLIGILFCLWRRQRMLASFLFGLGLGNHQTLVVLLPLIFYGCLSCERKFQTLLSALVFGAVGFTIYLYLPIRARMDPFVNFGDPETWERFWAVVRRKEFGSLSLHPAALPFRNNEILIQQILKFIERTLHHSGWIGVVLALIGLILGGRDPKKRTLLLVAFMGWLVFGGGFEIYSNLSPQSSIGQWRLERFFLIPLFSLSFLRAVAVYEALRFGRFTRWAVSALLAGFLIENVRADIDRVSFRHTFVFRDFAHSTLRCAPPTSAVVIDRVLFDEPTSALLVLTAVENKRDDIQFLYRPGTLFGSVYGRDILELSWTERMERQREIEKIILERSGRPIRCLAFEKSNTPFKNPELDGLLYREKEYPPPLRRRISFIVDRCRYQPPAPDFPSRLMETHFPYFIGKAALEEGDPDLAKKYFNSALGIGHDMAWLETNIGGLYSHAERLKEARACFKKAVASDFYFYEGHYGLGYIALRNKEFDLAISEYETANRLAPDRPDGYYMLGVARVEAGQSPRAKEPWEKYLELAPNGPMANTVRERLGG
jgi:tetratricopeptide (TPR) repeat protein